MESILGLESQLKLVQERSTKDKEAADLIIGHFQNKIYHEREQSKTDI